MAANNDSFPQQRKLSTLVYPGQLRGALRESKASQSPSSQQLLSGRNPPTFPILEGRIPHSALGARAAHNSSFPQQGKLYTLVSRGQFKRRPLGVQGKPKSYFQEPFLCKNSSDIGKFKRQNPTFGARCPAANDGPFPQQGKLSTPVSQGQLGGGSQEYKASQSPRFWWLLSGRNPPAFAI